MIDRKIAPKSIGFQPFEIKKVESASISNGIPVHLLQSGSQPILRIEFFFKAGTWFEAKNGQSYLAAKMLTEGTKNLSSKQIAENIAFYGAFIEIHHGYEHVNLTLYLMEKHLGNLMPIVSSIIDESSFPSIELDNLRSITSQTLKVNKEKSQFIASTEFRKALYGNSHPYGRQYWEEDLDKINSNDIIDFANTHLHKGNLEIFVSGQFDKDNVLKKLDSAFGRPIQRRGKLDLHHHQDNPNGKGNVLISKKESVQSSLRIGLVTINRSDPDFVKLLVANELLGGFFGSRLMKNIREEKGFTYGIHSSIHPMLSSSYFVISTDVKKENTRQTLDEIAKELDIMGTVPADEQELDTVKSYMLGRFMNSINTPFSLMDKFKTLHFNGLDYTYYKSYMHTVQHTTAYDVLAVSAKYLNAENMTQVVVGDIL